MDEIWIITYTPTILFHHFYTLLSMCNLFSNHFFIHVYSVLFVFVFYVDRRGVVNEVVPDRVKVEVKNATDLKF